MIFFQSFFSIAVLFSIVCLSGLVECSLPCRGGFSKGVKGINKGYASCQPDGDAAPYNCEDNSCTNGGNRWVKMSKCVLSNFNWPGQSEQQCVKYKWVDSMSRFTCRNNGGKVYFCDVTPEEIQAISCDTCYV
ncbi:uncharacterized protein MELLADRAFT_123799 [Melampsora larici-populina 98AG31]|uniref:Secreted protein n=1 Tax=Melampsora larici-populina (strain 98AG31 / pathotype 3-4-7) TaxID=747676 RepID=F4RW80_MELLP|nr:uncharacterized protein MELLADRAFT_123799 [Melampsora larici-populina 98AG31]EGG03236.1 secreted protein [Melampsora larici-populina 98AG31]